jgi:hypothetical protein
MKAPGDWLQRATHLAWLEPFAKRLKNLKKHKNYAVPHIAV